MKPAGPSVQVKEAVAALKAIGFKRKDFRVSASNGRGHYGDAVAIFLIRPEQTLLRVDEIAAAGFKVQELVISGRVAHVNGRWLGPDRKGWIDVIDHDKIRREAEEATR